MDALTQFASHYLFSPNRDVWEQHVRIFSYFPVMYVAQFFVNTPAGKTTLKNSFFNMNGKFVWVTQELVAPITFILTLALNSNHLLSDFLSLPSQHILLSSLYIIHYVYRAIISPYNAPSMSPMHAGIWLLAIVWNYFNAYSLAGFLTLGFGHVDLSTTFSQARFALGISMWALGLASNVWHENVLYEIRYRAAREDKEKGEQDKKQENAKNEKIGENVVENDGKGQGERLRVRSTVTNQIYEVPEGGLFEYCWNPHYSSEWFEWTGYLIACGGPSNCWPAFNYVMNEITTMMPRAFQSVAWYREKFGDRLPTRKAAIPFVI